MLRTVCATRYVTPLREGGSLPAIVEADDLGMYVLKFRGAGQGPLALVAELIAGEIGRALGLPVPELVFVEVDPALGRNEEDPEIRDLLKASVGVNLGLDYLPGSITFDAAAGEPVEPGLAAATVWFDALVTFVINVFYGIPNLLVALILVFLIGFGSLWTIIFAIAVTGWMDMARLVRVKQEQVDTAEHLARLEVQEDLTRLQVERDEALADRGVIAAAFRDFLGNIKFWEGELDSL